MYGALVVFFIVGMFFFLIYIFVAGFAHNKNKNAYLISRGIEHKNIVDSGASVLAFKPETKEIVFIDWTICIRQPIFVGSDGTHHYAKAEFVSYTHTLPYNDVVQFYVKSGSDEKHYDTFTVILKRTYEDEFTASCFGLKAWAAGINKKTSERLKSLIKLHLGDEMLKNGTETEYCRLPVNTFPPPYKEISCDN